MMSDAPETLWIDDERSDDPSSQGDIARAALTALEAEPSINWRDEPQIGRGYT